MPPYSDCAEILTLGTQSVQKKATSGFVQRREDSPGAASPNWKNNKKVWVSCSPFDPVWDQADLVLESFISPKKNKRSILNKVTAIDSHSACFIELNRRKFFYSDLVSNRVAWVNHSIAGDQGFLTRGLGVSRDSVYGKNSGTYFWDRRRTVSPRAQTSPGPVVAVEHTSWICVIHG